MLLGHKDCQNEIVWQRLFEPPSETCSADQVKPNSQIPY